MQNEHFLDQILGNSLNGLYKFCLKIALYGIYFYILVLYWAVLRLGSLIDNFRLYLLNFQLQC